MAVLLTVALADEPLAVPAAPPPARTPVEVRNRFSTGLWFEDAASTGDVGLELLVGDTLAARLVHRPGLDVELLAAGRTGVRLLDEARLDRTRVRALGLRLRTPGWTIDLGRFVPEGGNFRLVDGVQALAAVGKGVRVGAWAGLGADPYTTLPALRYGGGPIVTWAGDQGEASVLGEVLATPEGIDRASGVGRVRVELGRTAEIAGLVDVQAGGADQPVRLADGTALVRLDPHPDLHLDLVYDAWSSLSYLVTASRDPAITRFALRSREALGDDWIPQGGVDTTVYQRAGGTLAWTPSLTADDTVHLRLEAHGWYRHHDLVDRRRAHTGLAARLVGLAGGRLELGLSESYLWWEDRSGSETTFSLWAQLDEAGRFSLDASGELVLLPLAGADVFGPGAYADLFLDALVARGVTVSVGYSFSDSLDLDRWDAWHGVLARVGWSLDTRRAKPRAAEAP